MSNNQNIAKRFSIRPLIFGPGAVGSVLGYILESLGMSPRFVNRVGKLIDHKATIESMDVVHQVYFNVEWELQDVSLIFVATKAGDLDAALGRIKAMDLPMVPVIVLCNGAVDEIMERYKSVFGHQLRRGIVTIPVKRQADTHWLISGNKGEVRWGIWQDGSISHQERYLSELAKSHRLYFDAKVEKSVRKKWLFNTCLNSLCADLNLSTNGEALDHTNILKSLFSESWDLGELLWCSWDASPEEVFSELVSLINATELNQNSMVQDIRSGRKTESYFLAGQALVDPKLFPKLFEIHLRIESRYRGYISD
ncbi:MAG: hypothetical protein CMP10_17225 [Zetaproteobacteria bacterium]|nr:hypothetical protein [Pseudobdellovibrionaceae bacterium]|tara:strand:- start:1261 stop:2190 length:930 start_codon:yes stop_codon:yes gene_type:complete